VTRHQTLDPTTTPPTGWLDASDCDLDAFVDLVSQPTDPADYPRAAAIEQNVVVYDAAQLTAGTRTREGRALTQAEIAHSLAAGPGIVVFKGAYPDSRVIDRATEAFDRLIAQQHAEGVSAGDHFAKPGANDRVWNALEKLGSGMPSRSSPFSIRTCSPSTTPTTSSTWFPSPGSDRATR
jgi:hypothetical protein